MDLIIKLLLVVVVISVTIVRIWPKLKANNIFIEHPSNRRSDNILMEPRFRFNPVFVLWLTILIGIGGSINIVYHCISANGSVLQDALLSTSNIFIFCIIAVLAVFLNALVNDAFISPFQNFEYVLRCWLTTIVLAPIIVGVVVYIIQNKLVPPAGLPVFCVFLAALGGGFGSLVLGVLMLSVQYISKSMWPLAEKKEVTMLVAQATIVVIMLLLSTIIQLGFLWAVVWIPYATIMAITLKYFKFEDTVINTEEVAE